MLWLDSDPATMPLEQIVRQVSALAALAAELDGRLVVGELAGIDAVTALGRRLHAVLEGVDPVELACMRERVERLRAELEATGRRLAALRELKALFARVPSA